MKRDEPLAPRTTLGVGGPARLFATASDLATLRDLVAWSQQRSLDVLVLGGGSNLLVGDHGVDGLVIEIGLRGVEERHEAGRCVVTAAAGERWDGLVARCVERRLAGFECLSGIPGLVGASPIQNIGAYGQEVAETIVAVEALDRASGIVRRFEAADCGFAYRSSIFKNEERDRWIVTSVSFALRDGGEPAIRYPDLERRLEMSGISRPGLDDVRRAVIAVRAAKGMVVDPADPDSRSAGSFFVNPVVSDDTLRGLVDCAKRAIGFEHAARMPRYPAGEGRSKLSAAWLIENAGFSKGFSRGNAGISTKHSLALVNRGGATAAEILGLAREIQSRVERVFGVRLEIEPVVVGK
jgi:UDP-N-acetylmuramate dehydrogenase